MYSIIEYSEAECNPLGYSASGMVAPSDVVKNSAMHETWRERAKRAMRGKISQEALAERLGTSQPGLSHWLNKRSQPTLEDINRIADEIGVSRVWLTHGLGFNEGPGKELLDIVLSGTLGPGDLQALAVTAKALAAAHQTSGKTHQTSEKVEPARGHPDLQTLLEQYAKDPTSLTPESITTLRKHMERAAQKTDNKNDAQKRKKAGGSIA